MTHPHEHVLVLRKAQHLQPQHRSVREIERPRARPPQMAPDTRLLLYRIDALQIDDRKWDHTARLDHLPRPAIVLDEVGAQRLVARNDRVDRLVEAAHVERSVHALRLDDGVPGLPPSS